MVDVSNKDVTVRVARSRAVVTLEAGVELFGKDATEVLSSKGPVFGTAIVAGTLAAKRTADLIPFCHPLDIDSCRFEVKVLGSASVALECEVKTRGRTGVEMEAIVGVSIAAATIYDMCKSLGHGIVIGPIELLSKTGGKNDFGKTSL
jgi:cyclic pyranopterin phosphate synthase